MVNEHRIIIGIDSYCNSQILLINLVNLSDKLNNKIGVDLYVEQDMYDSINLLVKNYIF